MLDILRKKEMVNDRKYKLFTTACCRQVWDHLHDPRSRAAVEAAEMALDGVAGSSELDAAAAAAAIAEAEAEEAWSGGSESGASRWPAARAAFLACRAMHSSLGNENEPRRMAEGIVALCALANGWLGREDRSAPGRGRGAFCAAIRDIFGDPFTPVSFSPSWRTETVVALARGIYEERAWDRMPVLGDALEEVGADPELVRHCREPGVHVRACHVLDAALDRS